MVDQERKCAPFGDSPLQLEKHEGNLKEHSQRLRHDECFESYLILINLEGIHLILNSTLFGKHVYP